MIPTSLSGYTQESLLTLLCYSDRGAEVRTLVPVRLYESFYRKIAEKGYDYWDRFRSPPKGHTLDLIDELAVAAPDDDEIYRRIYHSLLAGKDEINSEFVIGNATKFVRTQRLKQAIVESVTLIQNGDLDGVEELLTDAMSGKADAGNDFAPMTMADLMKADVHVEWLVEGILAAKQPILLAGPAKSLKTSILLDLCLSLATGRNFLGHFNVVRKIPTMIMTGESGLAVVKDTLCRIARSRSRLGPEKVKNLFVSDRVPQVSNRRHLEVLRKMITDYGLELLAIDPAYLALDGKDANNLMIFGQQIKGITELCQELGVALLICHHTVKSAGKDHRPVGLADASWSGFGEYTRQWLMINHREPYVPGTGFHKMIFSVGGSAGQGGLWDVDVEQGTLAEGRRWIVKVSTPTQARVKGKSTEEHLSADKIKIIDAMTVLEKENPEGNTKTDICTESGVKGDRLTTALDQLVSDGDVAKVKIPWGNHDKLHEGFKLLVGQET
jgi:hypothetical protein